MPTTPGCYYFHLSLKHKKQQEEVLGCASVLVIGRCRGTSTQKASFILSVVNIRGGSRVTISGKHSGVEDKKFKLSASLDFYNFTITVSVSS